MRASIQCEQTYEDVLGEMKNVCGAYLRRYHGSFDFDDLMSVANEMYMKIYLDPVSKTGTSFKQRLNTAIWRKLSDIYGRESRRKMVSIDAKYSDVDVSLSSIVADPNSKPFQLFEFADGMPEDCVKVLELVFQTPPELDKVIKGKGGEPMNWRSSIRAYLIDTVGWNIDRVRNAFDKIADAL